MTELSTMSGDDPDFRTVKIMSVPSTTSDVAIRQALSAFGEVESFNKQFSGASFSEYLLVKFVKPESAQKLLKAQRININQMWFYIQPFWRNKTIMVMRRDDHPFDTASLIKSCHECFGKIVGIAVALDSSRCFIQFRDRVTAVAAHDKLLRYLPNPSGLCVLWANVLVLSRTLCFVLKRVRAPGSTTGAQGNGSHSSSSFNLTGSFIPDHNSGRVPASSSSPIPSNGSHQSGFGMGESSGDSAVQGTARDAVARALEVACGVALSRVYVPIEKGVAQMFGHSEVSIADRERMTAFAIQHYTQRAPGQPIGFPLNVNRRSPSPVGRAGADNVGPDRPGSARNKDYTHSNGGAHSETVPNFSTGSISSGYGAGRQAGWEGPSDLDDIRVVICPTVYLSPDEELVSSHFGLTQRFPATTSLSIPGVSLQVSGLPSLSQSPQAGFPPGISATQSQINPPPVSSLPLYVVPQPSAFGPPTLASHPQLSERLPWQPPMQTSLASLPSLPPPLPLYQMPQPQPFVSQGGVVLPSVYGYPPPYRGFAYPPYQPTLSKASQGAMPGWGADAPSAGGGGYYSNPLLLHPPSTGSQPGTSAGAPQVSLPLHLPSGGTSTTPSKSSHHRAPSPSVSFSAPSQRFTTSIQPPPTQKSTSPTFSSSTLPPPNSATAEKPAPTFLLESTPTLPFPPSTASTSSSDALPTGDADVLGFDLPGQPPPEHLPDDSFSATMDQKTFGLDSLQDFSFGGQSNTEADSSSAGLMRPGLSTSHPPGRGSAAPELSPLPSIFGTGPPGVQPPSPFTPILTLNSPHLSLSPTLAPVGQSFNRKPPDGRSAEPSEAPAVGAAAGGVSGPEQPASSLSAQAGADKTASDPVPSPPSASAGSTASLSQLDKSSPAVTAPASGYTPGVTVPLSNITPHTAISPSSFYAPPLSDAVNNLSPDAAGLEGSIAIDRHWLGNLAFAQPDASAFGAHSPSQPQRFPETESTGTPLLGLADHAVLGKSQQGSLRLTSRDRAVSSPLQSGAGQRDEDAMLRSLTFPLALFKTEENLLERAMGTEERQYILTASVPPEDSHARITLLPAQSHSARSPSFSKSAETASHNALKIMPGIVLNRQLEPVSGADGGKPTPPLSDCSSSAVTQTVRVPPQTSFDTSSSSSIPLPDSSLSLSPASSSLASTSQLPACPSHGTAPIFPVRLSAPTPLPSADSRGRRFYAFIRVDSLYRLCELASAALAAKQPGTPAVSFGLPAQPLAPSLTDVTPLADTFGPSSLPRSYYPERGEKEANAPKLPLSDVEGMSNPPLQVASSLVAGTL